MPSNYTVIRLDREGPIAEVVLNNPDKLNAMAPVFFDELRAVFEEIDQDDSIHAAILWAEGRHFTAGLDLKSASQGILSGTATRVRPRKTTGFTATSENCKTTSPHPRNAASPIIAAVHGLCIGGGVDLTTACDIRVCTEDCAFAIHETKIAIVADVGTLQRITSIVGKGMAREMAYTGKRLPADVALRSGLVNEVYATKDDMLAGARAMAAEIAANSPLAVQGTKAVLQFSEEHSTQEGLEFVAQWNASRLHSQDLVEAMTAFMEKREPQFKGV